MILRAAWSRGQPFVYVVKPLRALSQKFKALRLDHAHRSHPGDKDSPRGSHPPGGGGGTIEEKHCGMDAIPKNVAIDI